MKATEFYNLLYADDCTKEMYVHGCKCGYFPVENESTSVYCQLYMELMNLPYLVDLRKENACRRILEIGCGIGTGLRYLEKEFPEFEFVGMDTNEKAIEIATNTKDSTIQYYYHNPSINPPPGASWSFDVILCIQSSSVLPIGQFKDLLNTNGVILQAAFSPNAFESKNLDLIEKRDISYHVAMACKQNSKRIRVMTRDIENEAFRLEYLNRCCVKRASPVYEDLRLGRIRYELSCFSFIPPVIYDDDLPNYYDYQQIFPQLHILKEKSALIQQELQKAVQAEQWPNWPEEHYTRPGSDWRVFPFCYTFPADDPSQTVWVNTTCSICPELTSVLKQLGGIRTALFSRLGPDTELAFHRGWADLSNHILRCHFGVQVPPHCAMIVGGQEKAHVVEEILVFDDSKLHKAYNKSDQTRIVLIIDLFRPLHIPRGRAVGSHTNELDAFIKSFGLN